MGSSARDYIEDQQDQRTTKTEFVAKTEDKKEYYDSYMKVLNHLVNITENMMYNENAKYQHLLRVRDVLMEEMYKEKSK